MVQETSVEMPTGVPGTGPTLEQIGKDIAQKASAPEQEGLKDLLMGIYSKLEAIGRSTINITIVNGRVQSMKVRVVDVAERIYFPDEEVDGPQTEE